MAIAFIQTRIGQEYRDSEQQNQDKAMPEKRRPCCWTGTGAAEASQFLFIQILAPGALVATFKTSVGSRR